MPLAKIKLYQRGSGLKLKTSGRTFQRIGSAIGASRGKSGFARSLARFAAPTGAPPVLIRFLRLEALGLDVRVGDLPPAQVGDRLVHDRLRAAGHVGRLAIAAGQSARQHIVRNAAVPEAVLGHVLAAEGGDDADALD